MKSFDIIVRKYNRGDWDYHSLEIECEVGETCQFRGPGAGAISEEHVLITCAAGLVTLALWSISAPQDSSD